MLLLNRTHYLRSTSSSRRDRHQPHGHHAETVIETVLNGRSTTFVPGLQRMRMRGCPPSIASYGKVLHAAGRRGLGDQALALLDQYALDSNVPLLRTVQCLNIVLEALAREARDDAMDRVMAFFERMKCQDTYAKPDAYSYTIVMDALSRSEGCRHAERGGDLLEEMMQRFQQGDESSRPNSFVVIAVLKL